MDRSISPSESILSARRIEALDDPSPSRSHVTSTSEDSEDTSNLGFASIPSPFEELQPRRPSFRPLPSNLSKPLQLQRTSTKPPLFQPPRKRIDPSLDPSAYPSISRTSPTLPPTETARSTSTCLLRRLQLPWGVMPFDASFEAVHQRNQYALTHRLNDSVVSSSSGTADIEEVDEMVGGRGEVRGNDASKGKKQQHPLSQMTQRARALVRKSSMPSISSPLAKGSGNVASLVSRVDFPHFFRFASPKQPKTNATALSDCFLVQLPPRSLPTPLHPSITLQPSPLSQPPTSRPKPNDSRRSTIRPTKPLSPRRPRSNLQGTRASSRERCSRSTGGMLCALLGRRRG